VHVTAFRTDSVGRGAVWRVGEVDDPSFVVLDGRAVDSLTRRWVRLREGEGSLGESPFEVRPLAELARLGALEDLVGTVRVILEEEELAALNGRLDRFRFEPPPSPRAPAGRTSVPVAPRSLLPYVVGERFVAGAALTALEGELASYFDATEGLLVTQVLADTPAARAGLRPGDVLVAVDGESVSNMTDVRRALWGPRRGPVTLSLVRRDRRIDVELPH
jgi:membrane-associated protease RseP (regulator of RpoE activity)